MDTDGKISGSLERKERSVWSKGFGTRFVGGSREKTDFEAKQYLDSWTKADHESCSLAK